MGECSGVGPGKCWESRSSEGALELGSSHRPYRFLHMFWTWARMGASEVPWGPAGELLGAPSGHSQAPRTLLHSSRLGCLASGSRPRALAGTESAHMSPEDSPSWPFCSPRVPSSLCPTGYSARIWVRSTEASVSHCEAGSCPSAAVEPFIVFAQPPQLSSAGAGRGTRPPAFFFFKAADRWELLLQRR